MESDCSQLSLYSFKSIIIGVSDSKYGDEPEDLLLLLSFIDENTAFGKLGF